MAGEYIVVQRVMAEALNEARDNNSMSEDAMLLALFNDVVGKLAASNSPEQLKDMLHFQLEALDGDEHVVTRGC